MGYRQQGGLTIRDLADAVRRRVQRCAARTRFDPTISR
ncbi:hypothetical protein I545_2192 [Mycobacterium kansasii 662]|uniref:Uncharacterized protein n=2 Tax=Mycobacterium kansasii TaxID=1768 RepID=A0A1V3XHM0_MYCKA|nr:hypothetical protein I547_4050 [Mycobacterium kansasii 824]EUA19862.1 hypothetical protein I545_2192 [Mycobacterium kansasii 662]KEP40144.1 hypothetical protein MKSMC1_47070 [Mycobacterium kansasii]OOK78266.1 hypothetical protein BZL30_2048 [Mycobacterium kansasii]